MVCPSRALQTQARQKLRKCFSFMTRLYQEGLKKQVRLPILITMVLCNSLTGLAMKLRILGIASWVLIFGAGMGSLAVAQPAKTSAGSTCLVAEFKTLALSQEDVALRLQQARSWLQKNSSRCSPEQLSAIKNNSSSWLGHALTPGLLGLIEGAIEAKNSGNPELMGQLYESLGKEGTSSVDVFRNPVPRAPVVQAPIVQGGLAGAINSGNVSGPSTAWINQSGSQSNAQIQGGQGNVQQALPTR